jgi:hypothetical protein
MGAFGYADDIILLAPCKNAMLKMLHVASNFSEEYSIIFNSSKSRHIVYGGKQYAYSPIVFNGESIETVNEEKTFR